SDVDTGATQTWSLTGSQPSTYGTMSVDSSTGIWTYTLDNTLAATQALTEGDSVTQTYTVRVTDDFGAYADQTVTVTITGTNDVPVAAADVASVTEDAADQTGYVDSDPGTTIIAGNVITNDTDVDHLDTREVTGVAAGTPASASDSVASDVTGTYGTVNVNADGTYTYTLDNTNGSVQALAEGEALTDTFTYTITDSQGATSSAALTVTLHGTNDTPDITAEAGDSSTETLTETNAGLSASGTLSIFDVDTTDTVTAAKVNSVTVGGTYSGTVPTSSALIAMFSASGGDPSDALQSNTHGINWSFDSGSQAFNEIPAGETLILNYTVRATDSNGAYDDQTITVTITGTNDEGSIIADVANINEDITLTGNVLDNDIPDPDHDEPLSVSSFTVDSDGDGTQNSYLPGDTVTITTASGTIGTLQVNADGSYIFTPESNYSGSVPVVTYTASNATFSASSTFTITVTPVSDTPIINADNSSISTDEDTSIALGLNIPAANDTVDQNGPASSGDNPELLGPISLSGIPSGATLLDGTNADNVLWSSTGSSVTIILSDQPNYHINGATGTLILTTAQYESLKILPPVDSGTNFTVTASVTSYEVNNSGIQISGVQGATGTTSVIVDVLAVTDGVDLKIDGSDTSYSVTINEDSSLDLTALLTKSFADTDGSEQRAIILGNLPVGTIVNGSTVGISGSVTLALSDGNTLPAISITPPVNFSGDITGITVTLRAQDTDIDSSHTTAVVTDMVTLDLHVNPVAGDVSVTGVSTVEDTGVKFLANLAVTDTDGGETITAITVKDLPVGWVIRNEIGDIVHNGDGTTDFTIDPVKVDSGDYLNYTATPPAHSSADTSLTVSVETTDTHSVNGSDVTSTVTTDLSVQVTVTPVAEIISNPISDTDGDGTSDLTMSPDHVYSATAPGQEDTWFNLNQDGFNFKSGWNNQDSDENTFVLLTPVLNGGDISANGSQFSYFNGTTTVRLTYTGTALAIPVAYLDTVEFKAAPNVSGSFEIQVQALTVDYDPDTAVSVNADSGSSTISNLIVLPVADQVTLSVSSPATGLEDSQIPIYIRPTSSDPSETFTVTISAIPSGSTLTYNGISQTISGGSITIENFSSSLPLSILPSANNNVDFALSVSAVTVDTLGTYTSTSLPAILPINVDLRGVADSAAVGTVDLNISEAVLDNSGHKIELSSIITSAAPTDTDGSETLTMTLTGLASQFTIEGGTFIGGAGTGRVWLINTSDLSNINIVTPANYSGTIDLSVRPVTTENDGNSLTGSAIPITITVDPSTEAIMSTSTTANEDTLVNLNFNVIHQNGDTDETLTSVWIKADDVEGKNFNLYFGNSTNTTLSSAAGTTGVELDGGYYKLTGSAINNIYAKGEENTNGVYNFDTKYEITDPSSDSTLTPGTSQTDATYTLTVSAVTDDTETSIVNIMANNENASINNTIVTATGSTSISIDVTVTQSNDPNAGNQPDNDGSENLVRFIVDGVPDGITVVGGTYIGDTLGNSNTAQWMLEVNPDVPFNGLITQTLVFNLDGSASELAGLDQSITITALTQDTDSFVQGSSETWTLITTESFDDSGMATDIPAVITTSEFIPGITANEDTPINLNDLVDLQVTDDSPFSITLTDLPAGTLVTGMIQTSVNGEIIWTASSNGGNVALQNLISAITVTPPSNWNDNNHPSGLTFDTVLTTYAPGGEQNVEHVIVNQPITSVTDATNIAVTANDADEETAVSITINLSNSADGSYTNIVDGKLYIALSEANMDTAGSLIYDSSPVFTQTISGITGVPDGIYYVIDGVYNNQTLNMSYQPSEHASGDITLTALLVSQETAADNIITSSQSETIIINPVNSGVDITAEDISGNEDSRIQLNFGGTGLADTDGSEKITGATIGNVDNGYLVYAGADAASATLASNLGEDAYGHNTWSISLIDGALPAYVAILPPLNFSGNSDNLTLTVLSGEDGLDQSSSTSTFDLTVNPVADGITLSPTLTFGTEGNAIDLNLNSSMIDTDGSETVSLTLTGLGEYASFFAGGTPISADYAAGTDTYTISGITASEMDNLSFLQSARTGIINVTAYTVETANSDTSGTVSANFDLNISEILATSGNDTLLYDGTRSYDGLSGNDTIVMRLGESINFDSDPVIRNIEVIDLKDGGVNSVQNLSVQDVIDITDSNNYLTIFGDSNDSVNIIDDGNWTHITQTDGTNVFDVYTNSAFPDVTLRIQQEIIDNLS
ncbi:MAG: VCBS domain-containing protein, partial [Synergistaceae bacterium]|nr:VCBS domain-containing protein [Synergistaceae bacterium]